MNLQLYIVEEEYIQFLKQFEDKVAINKSEKRPYVGIIFEVNEKKYFSPLSSPKPKHKSMRTQLDFLKIEQGKLGIINLNNSIPIEMKYLRLVDINSLKMSLHEFEKKYGILCEKQIIWCNENSHNIKKKFEKLYSFSLQNRLPKNIQDRCNDFKLLEEKALEWGKEAKPKIPKKKRVKEENER